MKGAGGGGWVTQWGCEVKGEKLGIHTTLHIYDSFVLPFRPGKRYQATLHLGLSSSSSGTLTSGSDHGLTLELGVYVAKIQPGSVAAKEGVIAVGDRIVSVSYRKDENERN